VAETVFEGPTLARHGILEFGQDPRLVIRMHALQPEIFIVNEFRCLIADQLKQVFADKGTGIIARRCRAVDDRRRADEEVLEAGARRLQGLPRGLLVGDIAQVGGEERWPLHADAGNRDLRGDLRAIGPQHTDLHAAIQERPFAGREGAAVPLAQGGSDHQRRHLLADDLGPAVTECAFRGRV